VNADASVAWLTTLVTAQSDVRRLSENALSAIAQHAGSAASKALVQFAQTGTTQMRGRALTWLAQRAANEAIPAIDAALKDPELEVKKAAVNALVRFPNQEGVPKLIEVARSHPNTEVRRQAMLRLGDTKDPRAVDFFAQILLR
jgi:HEAT repeat protein